MRQLIKSLWWISCLALGSQSASAFSLLGPEGNGGDAWQIQANGFNPVNFTGDPPYFLSDLAAAPKNLGEGYRRTTPVMYYTFDATFSDFFGSNGEAAVAGAFDILNNSLTNVDSPNFLSQFPLQSDSENYEANALGLLDLKTQTLSLLMEQLGLADAIRYTWVLHDRVTIAGCTAPCPSCLEYLVTLRNFDPLLSPPDQVQYSDYVNEQLFTYLISEICTAPSPGPIADAIEVSPDPLNNNPPVASGGDQDEGQLAAGYFFTGLTRDDAGGLHWLYSTNNYDTPSVQYRESPPPGSDFFSTNFNFPVLLFTSNYNAFVSAALTNGPATLPALFPGLQFVLVTNYFSNVVSPNVLAYFTNYIGSPAGAPATLVVVSNVVTNIVEFYQYAFGNVVTNKTYTNTTFALQTITVGPMVGAPAGAPFVTNITYQTFLSNVVSGDYFIISNGACGPNFIQTLQTNVSIVTNALVGTTNVNGQSFSQNIISYFTNYAFVVQPCTLVSNVVADYQGIGKMQFVRVSDDDYDYQSGQFITPITNVYSMVQITNQQLVTRWFQRVLTSPDFLFAANDQASGPSSGNVIGDFVRGVNFNQANIQPGLAGPGTIDPGASNVISFDKVGVVYLNESLSFLSGPGNAIGRFFVWGSFDGSTNAPVVYPNGTSIANLAAEAFIQISPPPPALPGGATTNAYNVTLTASGGRPPYTWTLAPSSAGLPSGLTLSPGGVISGTPTQTGTFDNIIIQMTDSSFPSTNVVDTTYSLTIN
ncbi:MAG: Ig domain-containing protein [Verrucomicrobiia bacterium]